MSKIATFSKITYYDYKLPDGVDDLDDDEIVEKYGVDAGDCCLYIKLKDNDEELKIEPVEYLNDDDFFFQEY